MSLKMAIVQKMLRLVPGDLINKVFISKYGAHFIKLYSGLSSGEKPKVYRIFGDVFIEIDLSKDGERAIPLNAYEPHTTKKFLSLIKEGDVVFDVGAWIGYYTVLAAKMVGPTGRVIAIEASGDNLNRLARNVEINGYKNVKLINSAVGIEESIGSLTQGPGSLYHKVLKEASETATKIDTLDNIIKGDDLHVKLMILDVEGFEFFALKGAENSLKNGLIENLICEVHPNHLRENGVDDKILLELLKETGYTSSIIDNMNSVYHIHAKRK